MQELITKELNSTTFEHGLSLVFQPIVDVLTGQMTLAEVLLRWHHPIHGLISTEQWITAAEQQGHIGRVTLWLTKQVCDILRDKLPESASLAMNVSPLTLTDEYVTFLLSELQGIDPSRLVIEVTETAQPGDVQDFVNCINKLHAHGIRISLDDFGSGYSTMKYLVDMAVDFVKIDKEFVQKAPYNSNAYLVLETLVGLGHEVGAAIVMEGVETLEQSNLACDMGAQMIQGFFLSSPIGLTDLIKWTSPSRRAWIPILNQKQVVNS